MSRKNLQGTGPVWRAFHRTLSSKNKNVLLADALNLLSPSSTSNATSNYKPSLFKSLTDGPVSEQEMRIKQSGFNIPKESNSAAHIDNLLSGIKSSILSTTDFQILDMKGKHLSNYLRTLNTEEKIIQTTEFLYHHDHLTFPLFTSILLNKHLKDLSKLPFDINDTRQDSKLSWSEMSHIQKDIVLLKKHYNLKKPLMVIKNLKNNFDKYFLPMIKHNKLSPFHERIVWKFYFDNIKQFTEAHYIEQLNSIKSSVLIWESSLENNRDIAMDILRFQENELNVLQKSFFKVCTSPPVQTQISQEIDQYKHSKLLSELKKLSIKYKLYSMEATSDNESKKLILYSYISSLESLARKYITDDNHSSSSLNETLSDLKEFRETYLMKTGLLQNIMEWELNPLEASKEYD